MAYTDEDAVREELLRVSLLMHQATEQLDRMTHMCEGLYRCLYGIAAAHRGQNVEALNALLDRLSDSYLLQEMH